MKNSRTKVKKLPFEAYLYQCDCSPDNKLGHLFGSLSQAKYGACKDAVITKVNVKMSREKLPKCQKCGEEIEPRYLQDTMPEFCDYCIVNME